MTELRYATGQIAQREHGAGFCAKSFGTRCVAAVMRAAQGFFVKQSRFASKELRLTTGHSLTACQAWLREYAEASGGALCNVLLTDFGKDALRAIRAQAEAEGRPIPVWFDDFEAFCAIADAMRRQDKNRSERNALRKRLK